MLNKLVIKKYFAHNLNEDLVGINRNLDNS